MISTSFNISPTSIYQTPILEALHKSLETKPTNSLPIDTNNTVQESFSQSEFFTKSIYNAHGIVTPNSPNTLIAYA